jgi:hypothetical protein
MPSRPRTSIVSQSRNGEEHTGHDNAMSGAVCSSLTEETAGESSKAVRAQRPTHALHTAQPHHRRCQPFSEGSSKHIGHEARRELCFPKCHRILRMRPRGRSLSSKLAPSFRPAHARQLRSPTALPTAAALITAVRPVSSCYAVLLCCSRTAVVSKPLLSQNYFRLANSAKYFPCSLHRRSAAAVGTEATEITTATAKAEQTEPIRPAPVCEV